jgi:RNA 3'-terminal phosphate cyclase (ATP)
MLELDGSFGEGGGQILRTSLALALLTGKAFHLRNVRARRPKPGLQPQHLMSVRAAATVGQARVRGDSLGSGDLVFEPAAVLPGPYHFNIGTAGATSLVVHTLYLPLAWQTSASSEVTVRGGTHVLASPCYHFLETTWQPYLELLGLRIRMHQYETGFYPRGGGVIEAHIQPCTSLRGLQLGETGPATAATVISAVAQLPEHIAQRQARRAEKALRELKLSVEVHEERWSNGPGTVLIVILNTTPVPTLFFGLGARGKPAESVADEAVEQVRHHLRHGRRGVDLHSGDQLVMPLAVAEGPSHYSVAEVTRHLVTHIAVIRQFVDRAITCTGEEGQPGFVRVD